MTASRNIADLSQLIENASNGTVLTSDGSGGLSFAASSGGSSVTTYATPSDLPLSGNSSGDMAYVTSVNRLYVSTGSGWYSISLVNTNPSITSVQDASSGTTPFTLATDGTATVITITASDPEDVPLTYSYSVTSGSLTNGGGTTATVSQGTGSNTNVFTVTPSTNSSYAGSFTLTFSTSDQINTATSAAVFSLTFSITNSEYTTALITTSGSAGGNATFTDGSSNSRTISVTGNSTQTAFSPYRHAGYSMYFDGSGDYLTLPNAAGFANSDTYTVEFWVKDPEVVSGSAPFYTQGSGSSNNAFAMDYTGSAIRVDFYANNISYNVDLEDGEWHHIAATKDSNGRKLWYNGSLVASDANTGSFAATNCVIGRMPWASRVYKGLMRDFRISDSVRYTGTFTPPTGSFTSDSNTKFLAFSTPYVADLSSNSHSITTSGDPVIEGISPFTHSGYSSSSHGGSVRFDGSGDYLSATTTALGTGDWTVEYWVYHDNTSSDLVHAGWGSYAPAIYYRTSQNQFSFYSGGDNLITSVTPIAKQWYHIAWVHDDSENHIKAYINGKLEHTITSFTTDLSNTALRIGNDSGSTYMHGNIADFRITNTTVYTSDFTPPTSPLTNVTGTDILVTGDEARILDKSQATDDLKLFGNTTSSSTQAKYAATSMYLDGTGDYSTATIEAIGTDDFTVEAWVRKAAQGATQVICGTRTASSDTTGFSLVVNSSNELGFYTNGYNAKSTSLNFPATTWVHVAAVRSGTSLTLYKDGTSVATGTASNTFSKDVFYIGQNVSSQYWSGYIDDVRVTKGLARYTSSFTPPSSALQG